MINSVTTLLVSLVLLNIKANNTQKINETGVILCLEYIVNNYFFMGRSVMVSLPDETKSHIKSERSLFPEGKQLYYEDVASTLLERLNKKQEWATQTTVSNVMFPIMSTEFMDDTDKHYNYIIFTPTFEKESNRPIVEAVDLVIADYNDQSSLNIHGRYVVVVLNNGIKSPPETAMSIFNIMNWLWPVYNVLVLIPYTQDKVQTLQLYSWFPFQLNGRRAVLLDEWMMGNKSKLLNGNNLFPSKIPKKFSTKTLEVQPLADELVMYYKGNYTDENNELRHLYEGPEIDILNIIIEHLNISLKFDGSKYAYLPLVTRIEDALTILSLGPLADLAVGSLPLHHKTINWMEFSHPYFITGLTWYVPCPKPYPRLKKIAETFPIEVWVLFLFVLILVVFVLYFMSVHTVGKTSSTYNSVTMCFYSMWAVILGVSVPQMPLSSSTRYLFLLFVWYSFAMNLMFQTFFTSYLVDPGIIDQLRSIDELLKSDVPMGYNREACSYFLSGIKDNTSEQIIKKGIDCPDKEYNSCILKVVRDKNFSTLRSEFYIEHFVKTTMPKKIKPLCSLDDRYKIIYIVTYFKKRSPYLESFNKIFRRLDEVGIVAKKIRDFQESWRYKLSPDTGKYDEESNDDYFVFSLDHMTISFYVIVVGCVLSSIMLIAELVFFTLKK
ncbi:Ionotropic receptor 655 [Blattella germanica]|nr:Ionotropic receptor 655 [Blattella germanica]